MQKLLNAILLLTLLITPNLVHASSYDFHIEHNMEIQYSKNNDYVTITIEYLREVKDSNYFFPASGEKTFVIPDILTHTDSQIATERNYKTESITVKDSNGKSLTYFTTEKENEGIHVLIPNYKQTTKNSPYKIYLTYRTHDYVQAVNQHITLQAPSLPQDTEFSILHKETNTKTHLDYNLNMVVDKEVGKLTKIWPTTYTLDSTKTQDTYTFSAESRLSKNPYLEFGTSQIYRFELEYNTPQTDTLIPEQYSDIFGSLSKNIFEISLPRHFDENMQTVKIESISPTPSKIGRDTEGNIIATFEVDANDTSTISVIGYIWVTQNDLSDPKIIPNPELSLYTETISKDSNLSQYLTSTKYWQVNDEYIQQEAEALKKDIGDFLDLIKADYTYINENLDYDQTKADSSNERIGAKEALEGGGSVCMEYADTMITILRAQGIPARAALGYVNLKDIAHTLDSQVRHQWVQVWLPDYGWLSIDPTLESENMDIGQNIDRILWETFSGNDLSNTKVYSADSLDNIDELEFNISIYAITENDIADIEGLQTYEEISPIEDLSEENIGDTLNRFFKASSIGRSTAVVAPILLVLIVLVIFLSSIRWTIKKIRSRNKNKPI
ncbi:transglutaminase domain-containing protein [bacterium]|nr:transglutaminase domain-containing protein [bacterium]